MAHASPTCSAPTNSLIDSGQYESITCTGWAGGTSPYTVNQYVFNALSGNIVAFNGITSTTATSATFTFQTNALMIANSPLVGNVVVTDASSTIVNSVYSAPFTVNSTLATPTLTPSNVILDSSQIETYTATLSGGTPPYTVNFFNVTGDNTIHLINKVQWISTNSYPIVQPYSSNVAGPSCVTYSNNIYCTGGYEDSEGWSVNYVSYAPILSSGAIGSWQNATPYPEDVGYLSCSTYSNNIYCVGGYNAIPGIYLNDVYHAPILSSGALGSWQSATSYPANIGYLSCNTYSNNIYCIGGYSYPGAGWISSVYYAPILSSGALGNWQSANSYPANTADLSCVDNSNNIYCVGGRTPSIYTNSVYSAPILSSGTVGPWQSANSYPVNVAYQSCAESSNNIYCIGGYNGSDSIDSVYRATILSGGTIGSWSALSDYPINISSLACTMYSNDIYCIDGYMPAIGDDTNTTYYTLPSTANQYSYTFVANSSATTALQYNVIVTDSSSSPVTKNSVTNTIIINTAPKLSIASSNAIFDSGQTVTFTLSDKGGTGPFNTELYNITGSGQQGSNRLITSKDGSNTILFQVNSPTDSNVFMFGGTFYDEGTTTPFTNESTPVVNDINLGTRQTAGIAFAPDGSLAYILTEAGTVKVVNTATNTVINTITTWPSAAGAGADLSLNPSGSMAYVANRDGNNGNTISVIDTATNTVINTITVGKYPTWVAVDPTGYFAYVTMGGDTVDVINTATNTITKTITVGSQPSEVAFNPSGSIAYVTNYNGDTVSVIDIATNTVINTITVGSGPQGVAFNPSGTLAYIVNTNLSGYSGTVNVIDVSTNTVINTITVGFNPYNIALAPSGAFAYVTNYGYDTVSVINTATNTVINSINSIAVGGGPGGVAFNPSGSEAYVTNYLSNFVSVISTSSLITVNPVMTTPSITTTPATSMQVTGNAITWSTSFTGGTGPYTYNWDVYNTITGTILANMLVSNSFTSNSFSWVTSAADIGNTIDANVAITDSATTPVTVNSVKSGTIDLVSILTSTSTTTTTTISGSLPLVTVALSDNIMNSSLSDVPVFEVYVMDNSGGIINHTTYNQNQLPAMVIYKSIDYLKFSFACTFTFGSAMYSYDNVVYGLGVNNPCGQNYTTYGGSYEVLYSSSTVSTPSTSSIASTVPTTVSTSSTSITSSIPNNVSQSSTSIVASNSLSNKPVLSNSAVLDLYVILAAVIILIGIVVYLRIRSKA